MGRLTLLVLLGTVGCRNDPGVAVFIKSTDSGTAGTADSGTGSEWADPPLEPDACAEEEPEPVIGPWADAFPVPGATFEQGCTQPDVLPCYINELPTHSTTVGDVQAMATEVTQELWRAVMVDNPSHYRACGCSCPVETISWYDAVAFANTLSELQGRSPAYVVDGDTVTWDTDSAGWRLPTEAEWERMAKGDDDHVVASGTDVTAAAWYRENAPDGPRDVGQKAPTQHGLIDLNGNVWEWVWDWSGPYPDTATVQPTGPDTGTVKVLRGGSYADDYRVVRTSVRRELPPDQAVESVGVRLVRGPLLELP